MLISSKLRVLFSPTFVYCRVKFIRTSNVACKGTDIKKLLEKMATEPSSSSPGPSPRPRKLGKGNKGGAKKNDMVMEMSKQVPLVERREIKEREKLRHIKYREKGGKLPIPGIIDLQVIGTGGRGTPKSLILSTEHYRYLFNCGEGTQRVVTEHKMKPSRIEHIFITHHSWDNIGGLLGMALTLQGVGVPKVTIHGPPDVEKVVTLARDLSDTQATQITKWDVASGPFEDHAFKVEYVPIHKAESVKEPEEKKRKLSEGEEPGSNDMGWSRDTVVAYLFQPTLFPRKILIEKCVDVGIKKGPDIGLLKSGQEITLEDGRVIKPDDVLSEQLPSHPFLVLECPSTEYLDSLIKCERLSTYQNAENDLTNMLDIVVHLTPHDVMVTPQYQAWMKRFPEQTNHLILDNTSGNLVSLGVLRIQAMLNQLSNRVFPLLPCQRNGPVCQKPPPEKLEGSIVQGTTNLMYHYRPRKTFDSDQCLIIDNDDFVKEATSQDGFEERLTEMNKKMKSLENSGSKSSHSYPEIVFLGTGSSMPSKARNVSAIVLHLTEDMCMLLDCGEGTLGQLYGHYGDQTAEVLCKLKCIYVSHMHADHHLGIFSVLFERHKLLPDAEPLLLLTPPTYRRWIEKFQSAFYPVDKYVRLIPLQTLIDCDNKDRAEYQHVTKTLNLEKFQTTFVRHCAWSFGVALTHQNGWKITYSGDTMPCNDLVKIGVDSDLLIHEATMEDDLEDEAKAKTHSTTSQAIDIGIRMKARFILLNHFSQRYAKIPIFSDKFSDKVGFSFDNMRVTMDDIPLFPLFIEPLKAMFAEHYENMEGKTARRLIRTKLLEQSTTDS